MDMTKFRSTSGLVVEYYPATVQTGGRFSTGGSRRLAMMILVRIILKLGFATISVKFKHDTCRTIEIFCFHFFKSRGERKVKGFERTV